MNIRKLHDFSEKFPPFLEPFVYKICKLLVNLLYPRTATCGCGIDEHADVIISMTSFPERIDTVWITVMTLLNQTVKPRAVQLWLAEEQFPNHEADLPGKLLKLRKKGLSIRFCDNLYPHKKYYYAMQENPDVSIITVDDDVFYPENLVEELVKTSVSWPGCVCCTWAHEMRLNPAGTLLPYGQWRKCVTDGTAPSLRLMPIGCGGVLYPPGSLNQMVFDKQAIRELCLRTDDLWLKCAAVLNETPAVRTEGHFRIHFSLLHTQKAGLHYENVGMDRNDVSLGNIVKAYPDFLRKLQ